MKMPLAWHRENVKNSLKYIAGEKKYLRDLELQIERDERNLEEYLQQIERAEKEGLDGFDSDKFNKKKVKK
jgi:hypothetical protein